MQSSSIKCKFRQGSVSNLPPEPHFIKPLNRKLCLANISAKQKKITGHQSLQCRNASIKFVLVSCFVCAYRLYEIGPCKHTNLQSIRQEDKISSASEDCVSFSE